MRPTTTFLSIPLLLTTLVTAYNFDCSHIQVDKKKFNLSKLKGPHQVFSQDKDRPPAIYNTTWTLDICAPLQKDKSVPAADQCPGGTNVCGIVKSWNPTDDPDQEHVEVENVIPVAGNIQSTGSTLDAQVTRLKSTDSKAEGLQIELNGGSYGKSKQKAIIQFICDKERTGNEGTKVPDDKLRSREDEDKNGDTEDGADDPNSLTYVSYGLVEGKESVEVLRLDWRTKYACEDAEEDDDDDDNDGDDSGAKKAGWGFFTWFILIAFLGIAAYLIFGSWLNYNRYGARGWDLLPHGDTIRDVPYLFKDWSRKVVETVSGGGSRGGYSAV